VHSYAVKSGNPTRATPICTRRCLLTRRKPTSRWPARSRAALITSLLQCTPRPPIWSWNATVRPLSHTLSCWYSLALLAHSIYVGPSCSCALLLICNVLRIAPRIPELRPIKQVHCVADRCDSQGQPGHHQSGRGAARESSVG
jgi:hypothetical protein